MRISIVNVNLVAEDAIGANIIAQARLFQARGDDVRIYILHPPAQVPTDVQVLTTTVTLGDLIGGRQDHFALSDLYIYHYPGRYELLETIRGIDRGTVVFYYHNVTPPELWGSEADRELLMRGIEGKALVHYADLCVTPSPYNKQDLIDNVGYDADRIHVLPLGVSLERFTPGDSDTELAQRYGLEGKKVLLFVGRMAGNKRIDLLVEALAWVKEEEPGTRLLLVGDDRSAPAFCEIVDSVRSRAQELGIADDVVWTGRVDDLLPYYRLADIYVTASLHEGFGVPLIEAMACGVPVVASRAGAMPWVLGEAGLVFEAGDIDDLAEKILGVLQDGSLHQTLVRRGLERVRDFSLEQYESGLVEIVEQAVTYTLPRTSVEGTEETLEEVVGPQAPVPRSEALLSILADEIKSHSDVALRDYQVRSRVPLVGSLIAWVRRNLTSHLREPYLDPTIDRQVDLNRRVAEWTGQAAGILAASGQRQADLESRVKTLEGELRALASRLEGSAQEERQQ